MSLIKSLFSEIKDNRGKYIKLTMLRNVLLICLDNAKKTTTTLSD